MKKILLSAMMVMGMTAAKAQCLATSTPTNDCTDGDLIELLTIDGTTVSGNNGCGVNGYNSFPGTTWTFSAGVSYSLYAETGITGGYDQGLAIWIDLDNDGEYSTSEMVYSDIPSQQHSGSFLIPLNASVGTSRAMRVMCASNYDISATEACSNDLSGYGETEDYVIDILAAPVCSATPVAGTITGPSTLAVGATGQFTVSPVTGNVQWIVSASSTGPWNAINGATTTVQPLGSNQAGVYYLRVIASGPGCINDTTDVPFTITINFPGDNVCDAIPLAIGSSTVQYELEGATAQTGEVAPPDTACEGNYAWCDDILDNSVWFSFTAPVSGYVSIQSPDFDTQLALWAADACGDLLSASTATMLAANDDDADYAAHNGIQGSSYLKAACLTPGATYYIQLDSYWPAETALGDVTRVLITDEGTLDNSFTGLSANYCLPTATVALNPATAGGWFTVNSGTTAVTEFDPTTEGVGTHTVTYSILGCTSSSVTTVGATPSLSATTTSTMLCSGQSATLTASGATSFTWAPGSVVSSTLEVTPGTTETYTITGEDGACWDEITITQNVSVCTGIESHSNSGISMYPNPNNGSIYVQIPENMAGVASIEIYDAIGRQVIRESLTGTLNHVSTSSLQHGVYIYKITSQDKNVQVGRMIKQ